MSARPRPTRRSNALAPTEFARDSGEICLLAVVEDPSSDTFTRPPSARKEEIVLPETSLFRRCRDQEIAIAGLMDDRRQLREENADLLAQLEAGPPAVHGR